MVISKTKEKITESNVLRKDFIRMEKELWLHRVKSPVQFIIEGGV